jgi:hypothetical protein
MFLPPGFLTVPGYLFEASPQFPEEPAAHPRPFLTHALAKNPAKAKIQSRSGLKISAAA